MNFYEFFHEAFVFAAKKVQSGRKKVRGGPPRRLHTGGNNDTFHEKQFLIYCIYNADLQIVSVKSDCRCNPSLATHRSISLLFRRCV